MRNSVASTEALTFVEKGLGHIRLNRPKAIHALTTEMCEVMSQALVKWMRALLIDKSGNPQWDPARPENVTDEMLDVLFAPLPETEAWTPFPGAKE